MNRTLNGMHAARTTKIHCIRSILETLRAPNRIFFSRVFSPMLEANGKGQTIIFMSLEQADKCESRIRWSQQLIIWIFRVKTGFRFSFDRSMNAIRRRAIFFVFLFLSLRNWSITQVLTATSWQCEMSICWRGSAKEFIRPFPIAESHFKKKKSKDSAQFHG